MGRRPLGSSRRLAHVQHRARHRKHRRGQEGRLDDLLGLAPLSRRVPRLPRPNGEGSTYAPALKDSLKTMDYAKFLQVVASGQIRDVGGTKFIMPALGDNKNVMCYVDDLYVYLRARATEALLVAASAPTSAR